MTEMPSGAGGALAPGCATGEPLTQARYDIAKSRFAFGSMPVRDDVNGLIRWVGSHGVVAIAADGATKATLNGDAPEAKLQGWSANSDELTAHARDYFAGFGIEDCQVSNSTPFGSGACIERFDGGARTCVAPPTSIVLSRGVDGISIPDSEASATFVTGDLTTQESMYWPGIPAEVVSEARALKQRLSDPAELTAYKALLPDDAQGKGAVVIHHASRFEETFRAVAVYEVNLTPPPNPGPIPSHQVRDFDSHGDIVEGWAGGAL